MKAFEFAARVGVISLVTAFVAGPAAAVVTYNITQVGANVQIAMSGTFNTAGLTLVRSVGLSFITVNPSIGFIATGTSGATGLEYSGLVGPSSFGSGGFTSADVYGGDWVRLDPTTSTFVLPTAYVSGAALSGFATFNNRTFASLGLNTGQFLYTAGQDGFAVNVGQGTSGNVPEPATWALMLVGFGGIGYGMRRNRKVSDSFS